MYYMYDNVFIVFDFMFPYGKNGFNPIIRVVHPPIAYKIFFIDIPLNSLHNIFRH